MPLKFASMASSEPIAPEAEPENHLSSLIYEISNEVQEIMENLFKTITEINQNSAVIEEDIEKCKVSSLERKRALDEEKDSFQKAAYAVLDMLNRESMSFVVVLVAFLCSLGWCPLILTLMGTGLDSGLEFPVLPAISSARYARISGKQCLSTID
ncbi:hypothetical protein VNO78_00992 [Psophocarpus tetragonolobus]|uniref:Uncharacterized protein n=1 Tax=Psophocarpus tetragonolobus TaxID=3891 RepID=A0AAN9SZZ0_PSOTE